MPSTASKPPWTGVAGVQKLLGRKASKVIEEEELKRIDNIVSVFLENKGGIIAFQKDAYNLVKSQDSAEFSLDSSLLGRLIGNYRDNKNIHLVGVPPTRFLQGHAAKESLRSSILELESKMK